MDTDVPIGLNDGANDVAAEGASSPKISTSFDELLSCRLAGPAKVKILCGKNFIQKSLPPGQAEDVFSLGLEADNDGDGQSH